GSKRDGNATLAQRKRAQSGVEPGLDRRAARQGRRSIPVNPRTGSRPGVAKGRINRNGSGGAKAGSWATSEDLKTVERSWNQSEIRSINYLRSDGYDIWHNVSGSQGSVKIYLNDRYEKDDGDKRGGRVWRSAEAAWPATLVRPRCGARECNARVL